MKESRELQATEQVIDRWETSWIWSIHYSWASLSVCLFCFIFRTLWIVIISPITLFRPASVCQRVSTSIKTRIMQVYFEEVHHVTITHRENLLAEVRTQTEWLCKTPSGNPEVLLLWTFLSWKVLMERGKRERGGRESAMNHSKWYSLEALRKAIMYLSNQNAWPNRFGVEFTLKCRSLDRACNLRNMLCSKK